METFRLLWWLKRLYRKNIREYLKDKRATYIILMFIIGMVVFIIPTSIISVVLMIRQAGELTAWYLFLGSLSCMIIIWISFFVPGVRPITFEEGESQLFVTPHLKDHIVLFKWFNINLWVIIIALGGGIVSILALYPSNNLLPLRGFNILFGLIFGILFALNMSIIIKHLIILFKTKRQFKVWRLIRRSFYILLLVSFVWSFALVLNGSNLKNILELPPNLIIFAGPFLSAKLMARNDLSLITLSYQITLFILAFLSIKGSLWIIKFFFSEQRRIPDFVLEVYKEGSGRYEKVLAQARTDGFPEVKNRVDFGLGARALRSMSELAIYHSSRKWFIWGKIMMKFFGILGVLFFYRAMNDPTVMGDLLVYFCIIMVAMFYMTNDKNRWGESDFNRSSCRTLLPL